MTEDSAARFRRLRDELGPDHPATQAAFEQRMAEVLDGEKDPGLYFISFCDPDVAVTHPVPGGPSWLGACVVEARGPVHSIQEAWSNGCNPGGASACVGPMPVGAIGSEWMNRLLTKAEVESIPDPGLWRTMPVVMAHLNGGPMDDQEMAVQNRIEIRVAKLGTRWSLVDPIDDDNVLTPDVSYGTYRVRLDASGAPVLHSLDAYYFEWCGFERQP